MSSTPSRGLPFREILLLPTRRERATALLQHLDAVESLERSKSHASNRVSRAADRLRLQLERASKRREAK
jgi:hypothetical protein